jgi:hypothetical protein
LPVGPAGPAGLAAGSAGPAAAAEPLAEQAAAAAAAPGPAGAITLLRGAGLLLLAPNSKLWCQLSKPLGGSCSIRNTTYSRYTCGSAHDIHRTAHAGWPAAERASACCC